ncbi:MAG: pyridoxal phosphate-dependent aminotransferase [Thermodesulfobacteriota bacterium]
MQSTHGGNIIATAMRLGCATSDLIDMSSNLTPLGIAPGVKQAIRDNLDRIAYLPESASESLLDTFAAKYGISPNQALAGNGTTEFIFALPDLFQGKRALIINPTYSDYRLACTRAGLRVDNHNLSMENGFCLDLDRLQENLQGKELVFCCNPNNPTGGLTSSRELYGFIKANPATSFFIDESYLPFTREKSLIEFDLLPNLYLLSSFSKIYGVPGLRLGFLISASHDFRQLSKVRKPWGVNTLAQVAGEFLLKNGDSYMEEVRDFVARERLHFVQSLETVPGVSVMPGKANFILSCLQGPVSVEKLQDRLLEKKIMIRNCESFESLDNHFFRISLKDQEANRYCLEAMHEILDFGD